MSAIGLKEAIDRDGYVIVPGVIDSPTLERLIAAVEGVGCSASGRRRAGTRNLLAIPAVAELACSLAILNLVVPILGEECLPVRAILFDKTPSANWKVAWHQDLAIAARERKDVDGFTGWSVKEGVVHVFPPVSVLERMLTVRMHLDPCAEDNGPLRVLPGSHRYGKLDDTAIEKWRTRCRDVVCAVPDGGALAMRPLLLHASSAASSPGHRRVIHIEYAVDPLPAGLEWAGCHAYTF